ALHPGLELNPSTGVIAGEPTVEGVRSLVFRATNPAGSADSAAVGFSVHAAPGAGSGEALSLWTGAGTENSVVVSCGLVADGPVHLIASINADLSNPITSPATASLTYEYEATTYRWAVVRLGGLTPGTDYHYAIAQGGNVSAMRGQFSTPPATEHSFHF